MKLTPITNTTKLKVGDRLLWNCTQDCHGVHGSWDCKFSTPPRPTVIMELNDSKVLLSCNNSIRGIKDDTRILRSYFFLIEEQPRRGFQSCKFL